MIELKIISSYPREIIAVDEVGRSPLCGPVVIGAVRLRVENPQVLAALLRSLRRQGVKDSKLLNETKRKTLLEKLGVHYQEFRVRGAFKWKEVELSFITWEMDHEVIDAENIFNASIRGMKEACLSLQEGERENTTILIDGNSKLRWEEKSPWQECPIVKGDLRSALIGLASIIAKEKRDNFMRGMNDLYPGYGLSTNFGYPTKKHREAIQKLGPSPIHRKTFQKVKEFILTKKVG
jgi:ribonuclease HII